MNKQGNYRKENRRESLQRVIELLEDNKWYFQTCPNSEESNQYVKDFKLAIEVLGKEVGK